MFFQKIMLMLIDGLSGVLSETAKAKLEAFTNTSGELQKASLEFDKAVGEDGAAIQVAEGVLELADELTGNRDLTDDDKARLIAIAGKIVDLPDENAETKLEALFAALLNAKDAVAELVAELNDPTVEE
jgi:hypothetical protein